MSNPAAPAARNPLFELTEPPRFDLILPEHVEPAITELIRRQDEAREKLERGLRPDWTGLMRPLSDIAEPLSLAWNVVHHLLGVRNTKELRAAQEAVQPHVVATGLRLAQSEPIYRGMLALRDSASFAKLGPAERRMVTLAIRAAEHAGVGLSGAARERFVAIQIELAECTTRFANQLLDATKAFALVLRDPAEVAGLPPTLCAALAQSARMADACPEEFGGATPEKGPWRVTLDAPAYFPFMEHARRRDLRERLFREFISRASSGKFDNQPLVDRILRLRKEQAVLLGYATYAELSVSRKMAERVPAVDKLLDELRSAALPGARQDLADLTAFARAETGDESLVLEHWDVPFWAERLRERRYDLRDEDLRPYFALPRVLDGLFRLTHKLFGVTIAPADGAVPVWHPDVRYFRVLGEDGGQLAAFYLDPYSRPADKRGGAWMDACLDRKRLPDGRVRLPVAYLTCNQSPPVDGKPSLMTFREVETLFHEFGHGLQHMLTRVDYPDVAGTSGIEWDAVELPSQFMENWCYHRDTLLDFAAHFETGEPLSREVFDRVVRARTYRAGSMFLRQIYFATLDLELYHRFDPESGKLSELVRRVAAANTVLAPLPEDRFLCSFSHIFAGIYAAGYYSYKWAEVLSADAFSAFEEAGFEDAAAIARTGRRFRDTVLALGGSEHPARVFEAFRGRPPTTAALLRHHGLAPPAA